jgi:hypothetical protein
MACSHMLTCPLYPMFKLKENLTIWKNRYCEKDFQKCERYKLSCEGKPVPLTLLPNGVMLGK